MIWDLYESRLIIFGRGQKVNKMTKLRKITIRSAAIVGAFCMAFVACTKNSSSNKQNGNEDTALIKQAGYSLDTNIED